MAPRSLTSRVILFNLGAFLAVSLVVFYFIDTYQAATSRDRLDRDLETEVLVITSELELLFQSRDAEAWRSALNQFGRAHGISRGFFRVLGPDGGELAGSDLTHWQGVQAHRLPPGFDSEQPFIWETAAVGDQGARIIYYNDPGGLILQIGFDLGEQRAELNRARLVFGTGLFAILSVGALFAFFATRRALVGIRVVSRAASTIRRVEELGTRAPLPTGSQETDELAVTMNEMLDRIHALVRHLREVMGNIAHDIKTPVTRMRGMAEISLREQNQEADLAGHVVEECDLIMNLITTLLEITAAESGLASWKLEIVDLSELVNEALDLFAPVMENQELKLEQVVPKGVLVETDRRVIQRVIANLLDNAIKYTPVGGRISVRLEQAGDQTAITIQDSGIGIAADELERIFERFYRCDRSRGKPGNGLGLSFCRAAVQGLGGDITCHSKLDEGSSFRVVLENPV